MTALVRSLHHRSFAWLLGGQTLSRVGDYLYQVVLAWWVLQETGSTGVVPTEKFGRVASIDMLGSNILFPVGIAAAGWLTDVYSAGLVFILGGGFTVLLSLLALAHPAIRRLD